SRLQAVEHEALMTLLAERAGVSSREVVKAGQTDAGDAVLVLCGTPRLLAEMAADEVDDAQLLQAWQALGRLRTAEIAHLDVDAATVGFGADGAWLLDFGAATAAPTEDQLQTDRVQLLAATATVAG